MIRKAGGLVGVLAVGALGLAACGTGGGNYGTGPSSATSSSSAGGSSTTAAALSTARTSLGTIVVDARGHTVYAFDKDTKGSGTSACTGGCASAWPAVTATGAAPSVTGVTGDVGTITRDDGTMQLTLDGRPLYTYSDDSAAGDVAGQGEQGLWWVVAPNGAEVTESPSPSGY